MWSLFKEFLRFSRQEKKWWLIPLVVVLLVLGAILIFTASSGIAWALYDGKQDLFGNSVFHLSVSPAQIQLGVIWAAVVALLGGLFPSIRAARRPVVEALRAT